MQQNTFDFSDGNGERVGKERPQDDKVFYEMESSDDTMDDTSDDISDDFYFSCYSDNEISCYDEDEEDNNSDIRLNKRLAKLWFYKELPMDEKVKYWDYVKNLREKRDYSKMSISKSQDDYESHDAFIEDELNSLLEEYRAYMKKTASNKEKIKKVEKTTSARKK